MLIYDTKMFGLVIWSLIRISGALTHLSLETKHGATYFILTSSYTYSESEDIHCKLPLHSLENKQNQQRSYNESDLSNKLPHTISSLPFVGFHIYHSHHYFGKACYTFANDYVKGIRSACVLTSSRKWAQDQISEGTRDVYITQHGNSCLNLCHK